MLLKKFHLDPKLATKNLLLAPEFLDCLKSLDVSAKWATQYDTHLVAEKMSSNRFFSSFPSSKGLEVSKLLAMKPVRIFLVAKDDIAQDGFGHAKQGDHLRQ